MKSICASATVLCFTASTLLSSLFTTQLVAKQPDIVVFLSDDQSQLDCTPYSQNGIHTPNIQRLANAGLTFDRAYVVSPSCWSLSRAALLTGLNPARNGAEANHSRPRAEIKKWPAYFQELGYEVIAFGKYHTTSTRSTTASTTLRTTRFTTTQPFQRPLSIWKRTKDAAKPLCIFVGSNWPHVPWPEEAQAYDASQLKLPAGSIDTPATRKWRARYAAAVTNGDDQLGLVLDAVRKNLSEETLFVYTADHGVQWPFAKWNLYEAGVAVPFIVSWPGKVKPGTRSDAMVNWTDFLPTLLTAAGGTAPSELDGRSFLPVLSNPTQRHRDRIFTTHSNDNRMNVYPSCAVCDQRYKYIRNLHPEFAFTTHIDLVSDALGSEIS